MAASLGERPGRKVLDVFRSNAEPQDAYDFLSNQRVLRAAMLESVQVATPFRCADESWVHVIVDGTSRRLTDLRRAKGFGAVGSPRNGASGLKVVYAYAVSKDGVPIGILNQQWWGRPRRHKRADCQRRPLEDKATRHWALVYGAGGASAVGGGVQSVVSNRPRRGPRLDTQSPS